MLAAVLVLSLSFSSPANAETWLWSEYRNVIGVDAHSGGLILTLDGADISTTSSCPNTFIVEAASDNYDVKAALLMTVYARGDLVSVQYDADHTSCWTPTIRIRAKGG
jgi:hypothetical protein